MRRCASFSVVEAENLPQWRSRDALTVFRAEHVVLGRVCSNKIVEMRHGCAQGSVSGEGSVSETSALHSSSSVFKASRVGTGSVSAQMMAAGRNA